ncbi:MAG TPA: DNA-directed RNA polymerase subunit omega [Candidatus Coatesbacteria bacterium]|nr:DNA-directed RNA polymerase subunit omega [Candidatus Coatesbacteria bacterium]
MVTDDIEPEVEEQKPKRLQARSRDLIGFYQLPLDQLLAKAKDRYELVIQAAKLSREVNATRLRYGVPRPEKPTVVALNEILQGHVLEARKPDDLAEQTEEREE